MKAAVRLARRGRVARIECRWRQARIDEAAAQELCEIAEELRLDTDVAVVVLHSAGKDFCLGFDGLAWGAALDCIDAVARLTQPVIAAVRGNAWGEGCELALACDLRVVAEGASFSLPQVPLGRLPAHGGTQRLPRLVGAARALDILWSGRAVDAGEAEQIGLASRVVPKARLTAAANGLAAELAEKGPLALRLAKEAVRAGSDMTLEQGVRLEQDLYVLLQTTRDRAEGVRAFLAKRKPRFRGE
jgi:enoyl-CoA hydratase/carnithine racemase